MKLLYAFFDFSDIRGMREIELNFSMTERFSIEKMQAGSKKKYEYVLSCSEMPIDERLPNGFWDDPIYNVTAIIGDNGAGKSTLFHNMISALTRGLKPEIPFLLVLEKSYLDGKQIHEKIVYCGKGKSGDGISFSVADDRDYSFTIYEYPVELKRTKTILIDNTLSASSMELYSQYSRVQNEIVSSNDNRTLFDEAQFQFYNKSLFASICKSNAINAVGRVSQSSNARECLGNYFQYETFQELRVLFDRSHWKILEELVDRGIPVPNPKNVTVIVEGSNSLLRDYFQEITINWAIVKRGKADFTNRIYVCIILSILDQMLRNWNKRANKREHPSLVFEIEELIGDRKEDGFQLKDIIRILELWRDWYERGFFKRECRTIIREYLEMVLFLEKDQNSLHLLDNMIQLSTDNKGVDWKKNMLFSYDEGTIYEISIDKTIIDADKRVCLMDFLMKYQNISGRINFLSFSAGLSSGEKNILRMLTQLRYVLLGPEIDNREDYTLDDKENEDKTNTLLNVFENKAVETCDTLFLFLDEADLTYHPEWQRLFVCILTNYLPLLFNKQNNGGKLNESCKDIQVILATHSPLLLSNIPVQSCIFLKSEKLHRKNNLKEDFRVTRVVDSPIEQTFGANIHELLNNAFFLTRTMGEYAYYQIMNVYNDLKQFEENRDSAELKEKCQPYKRMIDLIGDPIIHIKLINLYNRCFPPENTIEKAITDISQVKLLSKRMSAQEKESMIAALKNAIDELQY